ncbi:hypothetical protein J4218_06920 [Candidatus Pacearchaeota archaeon]|nr:hypothetical protein [Candidatus Pacearchaeota archaeon]
MKSYWLKEIIFRKGSLHRQLGIKENKKLPVSLLKKIMNANVGGKISYNKKSILVTYLLKKRVNLALNLRKIKR